MARVIEIVKAHLETNGFDGLVQTDAECGCLCDDLAPCGGEFGQCEPAYRGADLSGERGDWAMYTSKEDARNSCAEALQRHNDRSEPTARLFAQVGSTDGLCPAAPESKD